MLLLPLIFMPLYLWQTDPAWNTFCHDRMLAIPFLDFPKGILHHFSTWVFLSVFLTRSWSCRIVLINLMCRTATDPFIADENLRNTIQISDKSIHQKGVKSQMNWLCKWGVTQFTCRCSTKRKTSTSEMKTCSP